MEKKALYDCDKEQSKSSPYLRICEDIKFCLKDPVSYKLKMEEKEWNEFISEIYFYLDFFRKHSLLAGLLVIASIGYRYANIP